MTYQSRMSPFWSGVKDGSKKKALDKIISNISDPIADALLNNIKLKIPNADIASPAVRALTQGAVVLLLAEGLSFALPHAGKSLDSSKKEKLEKIERGLRSFAGEKVGEELINQIWNFLPMLLDVFSETLENDEDQDPLMLEEGSSTLVEQYIPALLVEES